MIKIGKYVPVTLLTLSTIALYTCGRRRRELQEQVGTAANTIPQDKVEISTKEKKQTSLSAKLDSLVTLAEFVSLIFSLRNFFHNINSAKIDNKSDAANDILSSKGDTKIEPAEELFYSEEE